MKTVPQQFPWLEVAHFLPEEHDGVMLLVWIKHRKEPVFRTGRYSETKGQFIGSGDVIFATQPDLFRSTKGLYP